MKVSTAAYQQYAKFSKVQKGQAFKKSVDESKIFDNIPDKNAKGVKMDDVKLSPMASEQLIQKTLFGSISEELKSIFAEAGINIEDYADMDMSPDATAARIFNFTTGFFEMYKMKNPDMSEEEAIAGFEELVRSSVDKGYQEAMGILAAHNMDSENSTDLAGQTMNKLYGLLDQYFSDLRSGLSSSEGQEQ